MDRTFEQIYYIKMMYFNARRNMLSDNYEYYRNLVLDAKAIAISEKICCGEKNNYNILLQDKTGCCENLVIHLLAERLSGGSDVFCYEDDECKNKLMGVYIYKNSLFVYGDRWQLFPLLPHINLNFCYKPGQRRKYTSRQYLDIAKYYFEKSEHIENKYTL